MALVERPPTLKTKLGCEIIANGAAKSLGDLNREEARGGQWTYYFCGSGRDSRGFITYKIVIAGSTCYKTQISSSWNSSTPGMLGM